MGEIEGGVVRLMKLEQGEISLIEEFDASLIFNEMMEGQYFNFQSTFQRFDHLLVAILGQQDHTQPREYNYEAIDSTQLSVEY